MKKQNIGTGSPGRLDIRRFKHIDEDLSKRRSIEERKRGATALAKGAKEAKIKGASVLGREVEVEDKLSEKFDTQVILDLFSQLEAVGKRLVEGAMKGDEVQMKEDLEVLKELSDSSINDVKLGVMAEISRLSRIGEVWERCKEVLGGILERLCGDSEVGVIAKEIKAAGVGPARECDEEVAKEFEKYTKINAFSNIGHRKLSKGESEYGKLPDGFEVVKAKDLEGLSEIRIVDKYSEVEERRVEEGDEGMRKFKFDEGTGLIKTAEGLKAALVVNETGEVVLSFAGSKAEWGKGKRFKKTWLTNFWQNIAGEVPVAYEQARELVGILKKEYPNLVVTGYSQGGGFAQYAGIANGITAYCMNSAGLEIGVLKRLSELGGEVVSKAKEGVKHIFLEGEFLRSTLEWGVGGVVLGDVFKLKASKSQESLGGIERHFLENLYEALRGREL